MPPRCARPSPPSSCAPAATTAREPVLDPMCGSGTFPIEAAEIALRPRPRPLPQLRLRAPRDLRPRRLGRPRRRRRRRARRPFRFHGRDRDAGAIAMSRANADRAGVAAVTDFAPGGRSAPSRAPRARPASSSSTRPTAPASARRRTSAPSTLPSARALKERFDGWRVGLVTTEPGPRRRDRPPLRRARAVGAARRTEGPPLADRGAGADGQDLTFITRVEAIAIAPSIPTAAKT